MPQARCKHISERRQSARAVRPKPLVFNVRNVLPCGFDSHRPLHFWLPGVSLRCPRTRLSFSPSSHSLDAATTVALIECVDRPLGRVRPRWSHLSVIDPWRHSRPTREPNCRWREPGLCRTDGVLRWVGYSGSGVARSLDRISSLSQRVAKNASHTPHELIPRSFLRVDSRKSRGLGVAVRLAGP
jgi:hypothetical protein